MPDDADKKKLKANRVLFGARDAAEVPKTMYRRDVQLTLDGTKSELVPTPEGREYLRKEASARERDAVAKAAVESKTPRVPQKAKGHERIIKRDLDKARDKLKETDKGDDFER